MASAHILADIVVLAGNFGKKKPPLPEDPYDTTFDALVAMLIFWLLPLYFFKLDPAGRKKVLGLLAAAAFYYFTNAATFASALAFWVLPLYFVMLDDRGRTLVLWLLGAAALLFLTDAATFVSVLVLWVLPLYVFKLNSEAKRFAVGV